ADPKLWAAAPVVLAAGWNPNAGKAGAQAGIDEPRHIAHGARLVLAADEDLDANAGGVEPHRVVHVHRELLVGQFLTQNARAAAGAQHHGLWRLRRHDRAQNAARAEQRIA